MEEKTDKVVIGVLGASVNDNALKIIRYVNEHAKVNEYQFIVLQKKGRRWNNITHTELTYSKEGFSRQEKLEMLARVNWLLIPYGKNQYKISTSGILADALSYQIPIMALDSSAFRYYNQQYRIGIVENRIVDLGNEIVDLIDGRSSISYTEYKNSIKSLQQLILEEQKQQLSRLGGKEYV